MPPTPPRASPPVPPAPPALDVPYAEPSTRPGEDHLVNVAVLDGIVLVAWSLLGQVFVGLLVYAGLRAAGVDVVALEGVSSGAVLVMVVSITLAGSLAWLAGRGKISWRLLGSVPPTLRHVGSGIAWGLVALLTSTLLVYAGSAAFGELESSGQSLLGDEMLTGAALVTTLLLTSLLAPVLEELTFRGVLFQSLGRRIGWLSGAVVSSVVFALVHVEVLIPFRLSGVVYVVALGAVGFVFAYAFHRERSLVVPIVAHATFNTLQVLFAVSLLGAT